MQNSDYTLEQLEATILNMKDGGKVAKIKMDFSQLIAGGLSDTNNTPISTVRNLINDGYTLMIEDVSINTRRAIAINTDDGMQILFNSGMYLLPHVRESMVSSWTEIEIEHVSIIKDPLSKNGGNMNAGAELNFYSDSDQGEGTKTLIKSGKIEVVGEDATNKSTITPTRVESKNLEAENVQGENLQLRNNSDKTVDFETIIKFFEDFSQGKIDVENFLGTNLKVKGDENKSTAILDIYNFFKALSEGKISTDVLTCDDLKGINLVSRNDATKSIGIEDIIRVVSIMAGNSNNSLRLIRHIDSDDDAYLELTPDHVKLENEKSDTRTSVEAGEATFMDDEDYVEIVGPTFKSVYKDTNSKVHSTVIKGGSIQCEQIGLPGGNTLNISALQTIMSAFADGKIEFKVSASATPGMYYSMTLDANGIAFYAPRGGTSTSIGSGGFNGPSIKTIGITATTLAPTDDSTSSINISDLISTVRRLRDGFIDRNITINGNLSLKNIEGTTADFNTLKVGGTAGISTSVKVGEKTLYFNNGLLTSVS